MMIIGFSMANLTSYTCIKCGGVLNVDSDQEVLDCPFREMDKKRITDKDKEN